MNKTTLRLSVPILSLWGLLLSSTGAWVVFALRGPIVTQLYGVDILGCVKWVFLVDHLWLRMCK